MEANPLDVALGILEKLADGFPSEAAVLGIPERYSHTRWREAFVGSDEAAATQRGDPDVAWLLANCPSPLTRNQILAMHNSDPATHYRRILIASLLMWGYGTTGLRYPQRLVAVGTLLSDPDLDQRLARCQDRLAHGDVGEAYRTLADIPGIRSAFFTKFLYFLGRSLDPGSEYPLIRTYMILKLVAGA
jgi:8-oxoguanine DNA glycosylase-like protein